MTTQRKSYSFETTQLGERAVRVTCSTSSVDRAGEIVEQEGIDLSAFKSNPIILWAHNPETPVGTAKSVGITEGKLQAEIEFAPAGMSHKADEICALVKSGIVKTVSIGFDALDMEPMDPAKPRGPQRYKQIELLEISFVSIPANPEAVVTDKSASAPVTRAKKESDWKCGASRDLPIDDSDAWDGPAAEKSIFEHAGGDDFKPAEARKGFLVYDAANPELKGSYKLPIAHVVDGELKVPKGAIRAAASRLPQTDIPDDVKKSAEGVLNAYKKKAGIGDEDEDDKDKKNRRPRRAKSLRVKGMYGVGRLAYLMECLGYEKEAAEIEAALEGDESKVPGMLATALQQVGAALIAMTAEEVGEMLAGDEDDEDGGDVDAADAVIVMTSKTPALRKFRIGKLRMKRMALTLKAGRKISADTADQLKAALDHHKAGMDAHREAIRAHTKCADVIKSLLPEEGDPDEDEDVRATQNSEGDEEDQGDKRYAPARRRAAHERLKVA